MADQYQGFTNPTIIPDQKYGWQAANQSAQGAGKTIADYLMQRQQQGQSLQFEQAKNLANAQAMSMAYTGQRNPNIDAMLSQNPFGKFIMPQGSASQNAGTPQPGNNVMSSTLMGVSPAAAMFGAGGNVTPMGAGMPGAPQSTQTPSMGGGANFSPFNPLGNSGPVATSATSEFQPYVGMMPKSITTQNPAGEAAVQSAKSQAEANVAVPEQYAKDIVTSKAKEDTAFNSLNAMSDNLVSSLKGVLAQQGGGGPIPEGIGFVASKLGMPNTGLIKGMTAVKRDTAIAYARTLANGSQGVQKLMEKVADTLPDGGFTSEQAGSTVAEMKFTAMALKVAADKLKLTPDQIDNLSEEQLQMLVNSGKTALGGQKAQDAIYQQIGQQFADTQPRKSIDLEGNVNPAQANPIAQRFGMKYQPNSADFNPFSKAKANTKTDTNNQNNKLDMKTAQGLLQAAGGDKEKARQLAKNMGYSF